MGCHHSDQVVSDINSTGTYRDLNQVHENPKSDKRLPLNARQVFKLKQSWKGIKRKLGEAGIEMFIG